MYLLYSSAQTPDLFALLLCVATTQSKDQPGCSFSLLAIKATRGTWFSVTKASIQCSPTEKIGIACSTAALAATKKWCNSYPGQHLCRRLMIFPQTLLCIVASSAIVAQTVEAFFALSVSSRGATAARFSVSSPSFTGYRRLGTRSMSTATTSSDRKDAMKLIRISPKTVTASQTSELAELLHKAFLDFNKSLTTNVHIHAVKEDFGDPALSATVTASIVKGCEGFAVLDGKDGKMVGVTFVDVNAEGPNKVASIGPVGSISAGCGRKTFEAACQHAEDLGFKTLLLQQVAANTRSFSLYAKIGFEAKHTCHYFGGFISSDSSDDGVSSGASCTVSTMAEKDVDECGALHAQAHGDTSWDRRPSIAGALAKESPFPMLVARGADGEVVGYSTGFYLAGYQVAKSEEVFKALFREGSRLHKEKSLPIPSFHNCLEYPRLASWALSEKLTLLRVTVLMAKGPYDHAWPQNGFVFAPGIGGW